MWGLFNVVSGEGHSRSSQKFGGGGNGHGRNSGVRTRANKNWRSHGSSSDKSGKNPNQTSDKFAILDAPPGASCPVITTVKGSDFVIMVTEPTPFGLNDLEIAVEAIQGLGIPMGVVINRSDIGDSGVKDFCRNKGLPLLMEIPHHRKIAEGYAKGSAPD